MKTKTILATLTLSLTAACALAADPTQFDAPPSMLTRSEVRAELAHALAAGELDQRGEADSALLPTFFASIRSRGEVLAEGRHRQFNRTAHGEDAGG